jgi:HD-GYP domain-containing protein (c-di-GMP phosphodiesterase class II)
MYARKHGRRVSASSQSKDVLLRALAERHPDLETHLDGVARWVGDVAQRMGVADEDLVTTVQAAQLHVIGKVAIPDAIINKPGPLDEHEWEFVRSHTIIGQRIVNGAPALIPVGELIRSTHERYDGAGYPDGLAGEEIPLGARIIAACDAYDAMTSDRPYRLAMGHDDALAEVRRCAGVAFDPDVVRALEAALADEGSNGRLGSEPWASESPAQSASRSASPS